MKRQEEAIALKQMSAVIIAGGRGRRMGFAKKALLSFEGRSFLEILAGELQAFGEIMLSVDRLGRYPDCGLRQIPDGVPDCGPLGGLASALRACRFDAMLTVSCDIPLFERGLAEYLAASVTGDCDAFILEDRAGWVHPLCGVYRRSALEILEENLVAGNYKIMDSLDQMRVKRVPLRHSIYPDRILTNINTPEEYAALRGQIKTAPAIAACG